MNELDRQIKEYKSACDAGRATSHTDAIWLLNELIAERDALKRQRPCFRCGAISGACSCVEDENR